ncbi:MAG TPA: hypothetical protein VN193_15030 [Candidatus Angelobacter sp.]|jgi:hypothetical protein|nr:hypothetical protein [Candidatus Angelobacter sp.]
MSDLRSDGLDGFDPRLAAGFAELHRQGAEPVRPEALDAARRAMHLAVAERLERRRAALLVERLRRVVTPHRVLAGAAGATVALVAVTALGWNAPPGAPLHVVEVAHEQIALALPGIDRASLDLGYAEARLAQAAGGDASPAALDEAQKLLDDARSHLPGDRGAPLWSRWQSDSHRLDDLRTAGTRGGDGNPAAPAAGGATAPGASPGGDDGRGHGGTSSTSSSTTASRSGDDGRDGGGSTTTQTQSRSSSTSSGGDGGRDGGGGSSSSSTSSSTSGDGH